MINLAEPKSTDRRGDRIKKCCACPDLLGNLKLLRDFHS